MEESPAPVRSKKKAEPVKTTKPKTTGKKNPAKVERQSATQLSLGFEKAGTSAQRKQTIGKKHGAKKVKK